MPRDQFILTYFLIAIGSLFYLWGPRNFDPQQIRLYDHPPALMRLNVFMRDIGGWCSLHKVHAAGWGTLERFQQIMQCVAAADETADNVEAWKRQSEFLLSQDGQQYIVDLYATREKLRIEMERFQWHIVPAPGN